MTLSPMFLLDDTQAQLRDSLARWLDAEVPFDRRAALQASPQAIDPLWQGLASGLGLLGAGLPESAGGLGGGLADHLLILQTLGAALVPEPYAACLVGGAGLLQRLPGELPHQLLGGVVDGAVRPVLAALEPAGRHDLGEVSARLQTQGGAAVLSGRKAVVRAAPYATHWLVSARDEAGTLRLVLVQPTAAGITRRDLRLADGGWASELHFDRTPLQAVLGEPGQDALPLLAQARDELLLATGAEAIGVMQRLMRDTIDYVRQRKQFGVAISSFQVVQHRLADMHLALIQANALVGATLAAMGGSADQRSRAVASAQVAVARAARTVGQGAVQLHGGMGMTDELAVGHGFKRLTLIEHHFGGVQVHLHRAAETSTAQP